jgi:predicted MPP superfamily phosphohydrolase
MFLLKEIFFCSPLIIYVGFRIWKLTPQRASKILLIIFYSCLVLAFPLAEKLSHASGMGWANFIMIAGYFSLPLLLYLVLSVILLDLAIGFAWVTRILSKETVKGQRFQRVWLFLILAVPMTIVVVGGVRNNHPRIREYSVEIPKKPLDIRQLKIAFASDFHFRETSSRYLMERFVEKVNAAEPDIVLIGGDVLEGDRQGERFSEFEAQFRRLKPKYGVYGVLGNHDLHRANAETFFDQAGIRVLKDTVGKIDNAFYLVGRNDGRSGGRKSIGELLRDCDRSLPVIVLEHRPTDLDNVSRSGADILLSGHTHNGQLFPVNFITQRHYELSWGYKLKNRTHVFVTSGIQVWGPPVRTAGASEILIVNVSFRDDHEQDSTTYLSPEEQLSKGMHRKVGFEYGQQ